MSTYTPPLKDMEFVLKELARIDDIAKLPGYEDSDARHRDWRSSRRPASSRPTCSSR